MIVADTGPLNYLLQIESIEVLPLLFGRLYIPFEVTTELQHERSPAVVREWVANPPGWLTTMGPGPRIVMESGLHAGELAAIDLAERLGRQTLLVDDQRGKVEAVRRGVPVVGTLGVLYRAATAGMFDFEERLGVLSTTNFHIAEALRAEYLSRWRRYRAGRG